MVLALACGCGGGSTHPDRPTTAPSSRATPSAPPSAVAGTATCPATYAEPDLRRPVVTLRFDLAADRRTVSGHERVAFSPDVPVTELVFRLWANGAHDSLGGSADLRVTRASVAGSTRMVGESAGGRPGTQGTLLRLPLPRPVPAGETVTADLDFVLRLPPAGFDRWGTTGTTAWWGTGHPLLAWVRGRGWVTTPATPRIGEHAVSEAVRLDLTVDAPASDTVLGTGAWDGPTPAGPGRRRWHASAPAARDAAVMVAPFRLGTQRIGGVPVTVGVAPEVRRQPGEVLGVLRLAMPRAVARYGPYPAGTLAAVALPGIRTGGVEYPGAIMLGDPPSYGTVVAHELVHQWFYGLVGDDQARDPWLDEAFATAGEALIDGTSDRYLPLLNLPLPVGGSMASFRDDDDYVQTVYGKGTAALLTARARAGPARFDAALRCYVAASAWRVAQPRDLAAALAGLPAATQVLRTAGALPP